MSLNRWAKKRDTSERPIIEALKSMGMDEEQIDRPVELLSSWRSKNLLAEVKTGKAKLRDGQTDFIETWPPKGGCAAKSYRCRELGKQAHKAMKTIKKDVTIGD
jgi:hypothetical protein